jgi:hypothetical protein
MNVKELLDTDVDVLGSWFREGLAWWREELSQLAPQRWRDRLRPRASATAWTDGLRLELRDANGARLTGTDKVRRVAVVLAPALYLIRKLELPVMRLGDVKKLVENELDRLTPFRREDVWYDVQIERRNDAVGTQAVEIGILPRETADTVKSLLHDHKVYVTEKAYFDAHGWKELSPFRQACIEMLHRYRQICSIQREHYRLDCLTSKEGFYYGDSIPF